MKKLYLSVISSPRVILELSIWKYIEWLNGWAKEKAYVYN